jgi:histidyl-tRNA synthetase
MGIQYEIDPFVLGDQNYSSHTVFEIVDLDTNKIVAAGSRYNMLYKKVGTRKEIFAIGAVVNVPNPKTTTEKALNDIEKTKVFYMQLGYVAKLNALKIIDDLRKDNIPVKHKIYRDKLSTQISASKKNDAEHIIITGQREAMEGTVILRDKESKNQKVIELSELPKRLKKLI